MNNIIIKLLIIGLTISACFPTTTNNEKMNKINSIQELPDRKGERPTTGGALPHLQHTDNSSLEIFNGLADWLFSLEYIEERPSRISVQGARAAWIKDDYKNVNPNMGREFTHIHPMEIYGGGSQHLSLKREDTEALIAKGWGEYHPMDHRAHPDKKYGMILLYAPRDKEELKIIKTVTKVSYLLATNQN